MSDNLKLELMQNVMSVEYCPPAELMKSNINLDQATGFPLEKIAALGVAFEPIAKIANLVSGGAGQSGMYFVNTNGKTMFESMGGFIGSLKDTNGLVGGGQARMTQIPFDPATLCMAVMLMSIDNKLTAIQDVQKEILAFLELKEEAKLKGNLNVLVDILNNYKYNWANEKYKNNKHILVQEIKRDAEQSIILYNEQLVKRLSKNKILKIDRDVKSTLNKSVAQLADYQLAIYTFSFSSFLEVMLLENFDSNYLNSISEKVKEYSAEYLSMRSRCYEKTEKDYRSSFQGLAMKGLSKLSSESGKLIEKIPVISKSQLDENLIKAGDILQGANENRTQKAIQVFLDDKKDFVKPFIDNIQVIDNLYNKPVNIMFDENNIYIKQAL